MKKWNILILMILVLIPFVQSDICEDVVDPNKECLMVTPSLTCSVYNYTIINSSGGLVEQNNLTLLNNSVYYFNFSQSQGGYLILLCNGMTREVYVRGDKMGFSLAIIGGLIGLIVTMFLFLNKLDDEHKALKVVFYTITLLLGVGGVNIARVLAVDYGSTALISILNSLYQLGLWVIYLFFGYIFVYVIYKVLQFKGIIKT